MHFNPNKILQNNKASNYIYQHIFKKSFLFKAKSENKQFLSCL